MWRNLHNWIQARLRRGYGRGPGEDPDAAPESAGPHPDEDLGAIPAGPHATRRPSASYPSSGLSSPWDSSVTLCIAREIAV